MSKTILISSIIFIITINSFTSTNTIKPTDNNIGVILGDVVNVRSVPNTRSNIIDTVKENEYVKIVEWTSNEETIGNFTDKWVKIRTKNGKVGYLFGGFIFETESLFFGEWRYNTQSGETGYINFKRDLTCTWVYDAFERTYTQEGTNNPPKPDKGKYRITGRKIEFFFPNLGKKILFMFRLKSRGESQQRNADKIKKNILIEKCLPIKVEMGFRENQFYRHWGLN